MDDLFSALFWASILQVVIVDIVLGGDNAIVIAMAAGKLPHKLQKWAIMGGTAGAILLRGLMAGIIVWLLQIPYLRIIGGALLIWIGINLLSKKEDDGKVAVSGKHGFLQAILTIMVADATMSLDNVMGIVGVAQGNIAIIIVGMCISVPVIMGGSEFFIKIIEKYPIILYIGGAILGLAAGGMFVKDPLLASWQAYDTEVKLASAAAIVGGAAIMNMLRKKHTEVRA